jgi:hypothetical protein
MIVKHAKNLFNNTFGICLLSMLISTVIMIASPSQDGLVFLENSFLINFLGVLLGVLITLVTFIHSVVNESLKKTNNQQSKRKTAIQLYSELKDNTVLIFWFLIIVFILTVWMTIDIPKIQLIELIGIEKNILITWIKLNIMILSMVATKDTIETLFTLIGVNLSCDKEDKE